MILCLLKFDFEFNNTIGKPVSLNDFEGKPVIVQILGTWCPNCMDETKFLVAWQKNQPNSNIEIVGFSNYCQPKTVSLQTLDNFKFFNVL